MSSIQGAAELQSNFTSMLYQTVETINMEVAAARGCIQPVQSNQLQLIDRQQNMNSAMGGINAIAAEGAYLRLSRTVSTTTNYIQSSVEAQEQLNNEMEESANQAAEFMQAVKNVAAIAKEKFAEAAEMSDQMVVTTARLNTMNDGAQTTPELQSMIFHSAERSRGSYQGTVDAVTQMNSMAGGAFSSNEETIGFVEQVNKQSTLAGADASGSSEVMQQLTQAMSSGVLQGEEYNSILAQAPNIIQTIADYMNIPKEQLRSMAEEGGISADIIKAAMFSAADETNAKFAEMPMTFEQIQTSLQNNLQMALQPVLEQISEIANSEEFQMFLDGVIQGMYLLAAAVSWVFELMSGIGSFIAENWSVISPIIYGIVAALAVYYIWQLLCAAAMGIAAAAQAVLNAVMSANPIVLIIMLVIMLIAIIFAVCNAIAKTSEVANTGFSVITGGINVVIQFFKNLALTAANIALGIGNAISALAYNMTSAFHNAICSIQAWFYNLLSTSLLVIAGICEALNKLPFVEFDYSGLTGKAEEYARKAAEAENDKRDYKSILDEFNQGMSTYAAFQDGWVQDAYNEGAAWGNDKVDQFKQWLNDMFNKDEEPGGGFGGDGGPGGGGSGGGGLGDGIANGLNNSGAAGNLSDIAGNTGAMAESMSISQEDLKYLRDIAEQETINRFTVAEISIDQSGMQNTIKNGDDIDGFMAKLTNSVSEAVDRMVEGVHD